MQAIQQSIQKDDDAMFFTWGSPNSHRDHINIYHSFTKTGSYYTFIFDDCFPHLTVCHEVFSPQELVYTLK